MKSRFQKNIFLICVFLFSLKGWCIENEYSLRPLPTKIYGVTLDDISSLSASLDSLGSLSKMVMARVVFDRWQPATDYTNAVSKIYSKSYVMGEILDSFAFKEYSLAQYKARTSEYLSAMANTVDLWEIGNEINGEWLGGTSAVVAKMTAAYDLVKAKGQRAALTLYYNPNCWAKPSHEMFLWAANNIPARMKSGLDYVWVSYYEGDCNNYQPDWKQVMTKLGAMFPNSKIGIGECGTTDPTKKADFIKKYYSLSPGVANFAGGYFWWYFHPDMIPKTEPLWSVLNQVLISQP